MEKIKYELLRLDKFNSNKHKFIMVPSTIFGILHGTGQSKGNAYMIYGYMVDRFNKDRNYAWPSQSRIMKDLDLGKKAVINAIDILEGVELLKVIRKRTEDGKNEVNKYVVYFPVVVNPLTEEEDELFPERIVIERVI